MLPGRALVVSQVSKSRPGAPNLCGGPRAAFHSSSRICYSRLFEFQDRTAGAIMGFKFQGFDFLHLDSSFTEDELLVRRTARDFVEDNLVPIIEECFRTERFPRELVPIMGELGFFGANLEGYGCAGMSNVEYGLVMQELERG